MLKFTGTRGIWVRDGGVWVNIPGDVVNKDIYDSYGTIHTKVWQLWTETGYNPVSGTQNWQQIATSDKNRPTIQPASVTIGPSQFAGLPSNRKFPINYVDHVDGGGYKLRVVSTNYNDSAYNGTTDYVTHPAQGFYHITPAGITGHGVQVFMSYIDVDGWEGPITASNTLTL